MIAKPFTSTCSLLAHLLWREVVAVSWMIRRVKWTNRATADHVSKVCIPFFVLLKEPIIYFKNCDLLTLFLSAGPALTLSIALLPAQKVQVSTWWIWLKWPINKIVNFGLLWFSDTCCRIKQDEVGRQDGAETVEKQPVECIDFFFSETQIYAIPKWIHLAHI